MLWLTKSWKNTKGEKIQILEDEIERMWSTRRMVTVILVIIETPGALTTQLEKYIGETRIPMRAEHAPPKLHCGGQLGF